MDYCTRARDRFDVRHRGGGNGIFRGTKVKRCRYCCFGRSIQAAATGRIAKQTIIDERELEVEMRHSDARIDWRKGPLRLWWIHVHDTAVDWSPEFNLSEEVTEYWKQSIEDRYMPLR